MLHLTEVRPARAEDLEDIIHLYILCRNDLLGKKIYQWDEHYPSRELINEDFRLGILHVLVFKKEVLGVMGLTEEKEDEYDEMTWHNKSAKAIYMHRLAIHPRYQGKGYGLKMLKYAEVFSINEGYQAMRLSTYITNIPALEFYKKQKYMEVGSFLYAPWEEPFVCFEKIFE
ncbi:MAG: GNAT family N-acetyltransferase [Bacteroidota bacterium]|nr:GNAT family N-acetyltransferase [Bacteroidota bacterium]